MLLLIFLASLGLGAFATLADWRRGIYLLILIGILQDPVRKLTPGNPTWLIMTVVVIYFAMIVGAPDELSAGAREAGHRFPRLRDLTKIGILILIMAGMNGLITFGIASWGAPALSFFIYLIPVPAILLAYRWGNEQKDFLNLFSFYVVVTSVALIGVPLEHQRFSSSILGTVGMQEDWIRHMYGYQIRLLAGTFRGPDIMAWHAAMTCMLAITVAIWRGFPKGWLWLGFAGWGFMACLMSGRRKMIYMIVVFAILFLLRNLKRVSLGQVITMVLAAGAIWFVVDQLSEDRQRSIYTETAGTTREEVFQRLEGGTVSTLQRDGLLGRGLGAATQGARRFMASDAPAGWQEGGAAKIAVELGLPGLLYLLWLAVVLAQTATRAAKMKLMSEESHVLTGALVAILAANAVSFLISHQPFSDGYIVLMNAFILGFLLSVPRLGAVNVEQPAAIVSTSDNPLPGASGA
ncbi:MAG: hypothetical protein KY432_00925 [Acidobacteria bacterium]|nr:hypothetical protein [Acidobacteriota bacterium]